MLDEDKHKETARLIERAAVDILGDNHLFYGIHSGPARELAEIDMVKLSTFVDKVDQIRAAQNKAYNDVKEQIGETE